MYECVIFDVDGTLFDTSEGIFNCINYVLSEENLPLLSDEVLKKFIGPPVFESFERYCNVDSDKAMALTKKYREYYVKKYISQSKLYDGMLVLLQKLHEKGTKVAIATMKTVPQIEKLLQHYEFTHLFDFVKGVLVDGDSKVSMIMEIVNCCNIQDKKKAVMIGDTYSDAKAAECAGVDFIGVTYGFGIQSVADLGNTSYDKICNNLEEMYKLILAS